MSEEADKQRALKYRDHDLPIEDIPSRDVETIRGFAVRDFVTSRENDQVKLIVNAFLGYLTSHGYRVVKKEKDRARALHVIKEALYCHLPGHKECPDFIAETVLQSLEGIVE